MNHKIPTFKKKGLAESLAELYESFEGFERDKYSSVHDFDETFNGPKVIDWSVAEPVINSVKKLFRDEKFVNEIFDKRKPGIVIFDNLFKNPVDYERAIASLFQDGYIKENGFIEDEYGGRYKRYKRVTTIYTLKVFIKKLNETGFFVNRVFANDIDNILKRSFSEKKKHTGTKYRKDKKNPPTFSFDFTPTI